MDALKLPTLSVPMTMLPGAQRAKQKEEIVEGKIILVTSTTNEVYIGLAGNNVLYEVNPNTPTEIELDIRKGGLTSLHAFLQSDKAALQVNEYITKVDLSQLYTAKVSDIRDSFSKLYSLIELKLSANKFANSVDAESIISECHNITALDMSNIDVSRTTNFSSAFAGCYSLADFISFKNIKASINFVDCPLTRESALSVIDNLAYVESAQTVSFSPSTYATLTDEDKAIATSKNWRVEQGTANEVSLITIVSKANEVNLREFRSIYKHACIPNYPTILKADVAIPTSIKEFATNQNEIVNVDLSRWNLSKLANIMSAFEGCNSLVSVFFPEMLSMRYVEAAFKGCESLEMLDIYLLDFDKVTTVAGMFDGCSSLTTLRFGYNLKVSIDFRDCPLSHDSALSVIDGLASVTTFERVIFSDATYNTLTEDEINLAVEKGWDIIPLSLVGKTITVMMDGHNGYMGIRVTNNNFGNYTLYPIKFLNVKTRIELKQIPTTSMFHFLYAENTGLYKYNRPISFLDISNLDTSKVSVLNSAFKFIASLTRLDLSKNNWDSLIDIRGAFSYCTNLSSLDISSMDFTNTLYAGGICEQSTNLTDLKFAYNCRVSIDLHWSPLTLASARSVIDGLAEVDTTQTVTFKTSTYNTLTEADIAKATSKGWTIVSA